MGIDSRSTLGGLCTVVAVCAGIVCPERVAVGQACEPLLSFETTVVEVSDRPIDVMFADFDGDGDTDALVYLASDDASFALLKNNGLGRFAPEEYVPPVPLIRVDSFRVIDVDSDGDLDFLALWWTDPGSRVFLNEGDGSFVETSTPLTGIESQILAFGDVDEDGRFDVVFADSSRLYVKTGEAGGGFLDLVDVAIGAEIRGVALADVDADGALDIVVGHKLFSSFRVGVLLNDGGGGFAEPVWSDVQVDPAMMHVGDLDLDGDSDLVLWSRFTLGVSVLLSDRDGAYAVGLLADSNELRDVSVVDMTGNGLLEIVAHDHVNDEFVVFGNDGGGEFAQSQRFALPGVFRLYVRVEELNGVGGPEIVVGDIVDDLLIVLLNSCGVFGGCNVADIAAPAGVLDELDLELFLSSFELLEPVADVAEPFGTFDLSDVVEFVGAFVDGCL